MPPEQPLPGSTPSGAPYDMYAMTAAHRTLPLPAYVRVTNLTNGRSVVVRVNDRGPFRKNRIIDLSYVAAAKLVMIRDGTALVEVVAVGPSSPAPAPAPVARQFYAQAGAFTEEVNARRLADRLAAAGLTDVVVASARTGGRQLYRVRVGPFKNRYEAMNYRTEFEKREHIVTFLVEPPRPVTATRTRPVVND